MSGLPRLLVGIFVAILVANTAFAGSLTVRIQDHRCQAVFAPAGSSANSHVFLGRISSGES